MKWREYADAGIPEYWVIDETPDDPTDATVEIYRLRSGSNASQNIAKLAALLHEGTPAG